MFPLHCDGRKALEYEKTGSPKGKSRSTSKVLVAAQLLSQYRTSQKTMKRLMCVLFVVTPLVILSNNEIKSLKIDEDRSCPPNHGCVVKQGCQAIQTLYEKKDSPRSSAREKSLALNELRSLICNYKEKGFCCKPDFKNGLFL